MAWAFTEPALRLLPHTSHTLPRLRWDRVHASRAHLVVVNQSWRQFLSHDTDLCVCVVTRCDIFLLFKIHKSPRCLHIPLWPILGKKSGDVFKPASGELCHSACDRASGSIPRSPTLVCVCTRLRMQRKLRDGLTAERKRPTLSTDLINMPTSDPGAEHALCNVFILWQKMTSHLYVVPSQCAPSLRCTAISWRQDLFWL